jgi:acyl-CoA thioesterase I
MGRWWAALKVALTLAVLAPATTAAAAPEPCRLVVLGDSLTAGYGLASDEGFPAQLEAALRDEGVACAVIDAGVSGDTTAGGRARLDWLLADQPTHVIVALGANDGLRALSPEQMEANLEAILARLEAEGVDALLAGMYAPPNLGAAYADEFAAVFPRLAERYGVPLYPFFLDGVAGDPGLNLSDGVHPTAAGVAVMIERILPLVVAWLTSEPPAPS